MPSPTPIQRLRSLDRSSPRFPGQITKLLQGKKYKDWVDNIHDGDSSQLVEHIDDVCPRVSCASWFLKLLQVLNTLSPDTSASRTCLHELGVVCGSWKIVPQSHILPTSLLNVNERPIATRGPCDVHEAFLKGSKVWVKKQRRYSTAGPKDVERVREGNFYLPQFTSNKTCRVFSKKPFCGNA